MGDSQNLENRLIELMRQDKFRMIALAAVSKLSLPDCWVAAGFIRNLVWDELHQSKMALNDVDVIYFDPNDLDGVLGLQAQRELKKSMPAVNWQLKNQAVMHIKNGHPASRDSEDAMRYWPEQETAVAARLDAENNLIIIAPFGLTSLFSGLITLNPNGDVDAFHQRLNRKNWLHIWPKLKTLDLEPECKN